MTAIVIAEHDNQQLKAATLNTVTAATELDDTVHVLVIGYQCQSVVDEACQINGVAEVYVLEGEQYTHLLAEDITVVMVKLAKKHQFILAAANTFGKNFMPRLAALLDVGQLSDVIKIIDQQTFVRPMYAGNVLATVRSMDAIKLLTVRPTAFAAAGLADQKAAIKQLDINVENSNVRFVKLEGSNATRPELNNARVIVSGGRGLQSQENFSLIERLADQLQAAVGATRAAVDAGFVPNDYQVGQTGKIVAPELYIAIGISGAIQHIAGMKDSKVIVAINKDEQAPIFEIATYGLVGDLFKIVPELITALNKEVKS